ncbi:MAG: hypothetical protein G01um101419_216 [Parcubacteria group bacterium Gr01-1014_19]|nr:MAG: hypothetical protein G01um101419_216 [Parcubacteria group bacterium Gr01-1014_19]
MKQAILAALISGSLALAGLFLLTQYLQPTAPAPASDNGPIEITDELI